MTAKPINLGMNKRVESAETLPSRFYIDPAILTLEKERIFRRTWQLVGTLSQTCGEAGGAKRTIADPGAFFTMDVVGEPVSDAFDLYPWIRLEVRVIPVTSSTLHTTLDSCGEIHR
jgi:hypothetical protein